MDVFLSTYYYLDYGRQNDAAGIRKKMFNKYFNYNN